MRKKIATLLLALVMCLSLCTPAMATKLGIHTQATPDGETNNAVTVLAANDILAGKHIRDVTAGATATITGTSSISVSAGSKVNGVQLTTGYSQSFSYSVEGPGDGLTLNNGAIVTHRTCFAVLYGTVVQTAFGRRYIDPDTAVVMTYSILASIGVPTYCGQARHGGTLYFSGPYAYRSAFESHPSPFI